MSPTRLLLTGFVAGAVVAGVLLWHGEPAPAPEKPGLPPSAPVAAPAAAPVAPPAAAKATATALTATVMRAAIVERLKSAPLSADVLAGLASGDVDGVVRRLAAASTPGSAALLAELADLCDEVGRGSATDAAAEARTALGPAGRDSALAASLEALIAARREATARLAAGCASARFDAAAIQQRLEATARNGDAASLERLALRGAVDEGRIASAALLGAPGAQLRLGLEHLQDQPGVARSWLEAAAKHSAEAEADYGACLLAGCGANPDPTAARTALEQAARRGEPFALGVLASGEDVNRWSPLTAPVAPLLPREPDSMGLGAADRYAWAAFAGELAARGCFGFDITIAAEALAARPRLERALNPADVAAGEQAARTLEAASGPDARRARGCDQN